MEIPKCESCGRIAQYKCAIDGKYLCCECARFVPVSKDHVLSQEKSSVQIRILDKMEQDPAERTLFEALEDITDCPPPKDVDLKTEWIPGPPYTHEEYNVKTMAVYVNGEHAGYLDFVFTIDFDEDMAIQFWEMAVHPKFQGTGVFSAMIRELKDIAKENGLKKLYVSHENDNLPAFIAHYVLGGKIHSVKDTKNGGKRFGIPKRNDLIFVYELENDALI